MGAILNHFNEWHKGHKDRRRERMEVREDKLAGEVSKEEEEAKARWSRWWRVGQECAIRQRTSITTWTLMMIDGITDNYQCPLTKRPLSLLLAIFFYRRINYFSHLFCPSIHYLPTMDPANYLRGIIRTLCFKSHWTYNPSRPNQTR